MRVCACAALAALLAAPPVLAAPPASPDLRLVEAVKGRNAAAVRTLLRQHPNVDVRQPDGATALHWAVHWEDLPTVDLLLNAGASANVANDLGVTPMTMAAEDGSGAIVERLLKAGANANAAIGSGETALMLAARAGSLSSVNALIAHGANVNAAESTRSQTALMWAIANVHPEIAAVLIAHGADVRAQSRPKPRVLNMGGHRGGATNAPLAELPEGGSTPMLFAARSGDLASARLLRAAGASVNEAQADGNTALIVAVHSGHGTLAAYLLDQGAEVNAAPMGYTALHAAVLRGTLSDRRSNNPDPGAGVPLVRALLSRGADPNARLTKGTPLRRWSHDFAFSAQWIGATPLWLAAKFLELDMMKVLVDGGADPNIAAKDGSTPLLVAAGDGYSRSSGSVAFIKDRRDFSYYNSEPEEIAAKIPVDEERHALEAVRYILGFGIDVNAAAGTGNTALHAAASLGMDSVVQMLVDRGATINVKNKAGQTPLAMARRDTDTRGYAGDTSRSVELGSTAALLRKLGAQ